MKSKRSSGLGGGNGTSERQAASTGKASREVDSREEEDSIEESLNKLLAEADPEGHKAAADPSLVETAPGGEADALRTAALETTQETAPSDQERAIPVRTPEELASMSGPALVDDAKEEVTDVESPEALAALAAASADKAEAAESGARAAESAADASETPVRDELTASLLKAVVPQEEIVTATGGGGLSSNDVITAENVGFFNPPTGEARGTEQGESSVTGDEASTANLHLSAEAREERDRVMRRSRPPTPSTPLPRFGGETAQGSGDEPEAELELSDLDYERQRSPEPSLSASGEDAPSARRTGPQAAWPSVAPLSDSGPVRRTPPPFSASITGTGRHTLPPPGTPTPGSPTRGRLPTPHAMSPLGTPGPRISSPAIPIQAPIGSAGALSTTRSTSAVFSKVQLPLGGLVTVVGAAFGVGLIIGAVLWRGGAGEAGAESAAARAGDEARTAPPATEPPPAAAPAATPPAPVATTPAPVAPIPPAPAAIEPPAPSAQPAPQPSPGTSATAAGGGGPSDGLSASAKKVAAASAKLPRPAKRPPGAPGAVGAPAAPSAGKAKSATWVDPFAQ